MIKIFLISEIICFTLAALVHFGIIAQGYEHQKARVAESIIALILLIGLVVILIKPNLKRKAGIFVQAIALFGTFIGLITIIIGVGPQTFPDIIFHSAIIIILIWGLITAKSQEI